MTQRFDVRILNGETVVVESIIRVRQAFLVSPIR